MQTPTLKTHSSPFLNKTDKSHPSSPSKKQSFTGLFQFKSQKSLAFTSKVHPKHSKAYYHRLKPKHGPIPHRLNSKNSRAVKKMSEIRKFVRSESIRKSKDYQVSDFDELRHPNLLKYHFELPKSVKSLKKNPSKQKPSKFKDRRTPNLDLRLVHSNKLKHGLVKVKETIGKVDKAVVKEVKSEFHSAISEVDLAASGFLNYSQFCKTLNLLKFIENSFNKSESETELVLRAWRILGGFDEGKVKIEDFYYFLLAILDVHFKFESQILASPQVRQKKSFWSLNSKEQSKLHQEFMQFYLHRIRPKITRSAIHSNPSSSSQSISNSSNPEIVILESSVLKPDPQHLLEDQKSVPIDTSYLNSRIIRKVSLRELSNTPNGLGSKHPSGNFSGQSACETPKDLSFNNSISEDLLIKPFYSPPAASKGLINSIQVRRVSTRTELDLSKHDLDNSVSYKSPGMKFRFPGLDENSDSSILNISEVQPKINVGRRGKRIATIAERGIEERNDYSQFLDSFAN